MSKKFLINTKLLSRELAFVTKTIGGSNPMWNNVVLEADGNHLTIYGTNGINSAITKTTLNQPITELINIAMDGKKLVKIVNLIDDELVTVSETDKKITLITPEGRFPFDKLEDAISHVKSFLNTNLDAGEEFKVRSKQLIEAMTIAEVFSADENTTKVAMAGIQIDIDDKALHSRAMDGKKAIDATIVDEMAERKAGSIFIISEGISLLKGIVDVAEYVNIRKTDSTLVFTSGTRTCYLRRSIVENLPNIAAFVDKFSAENTSQAVVDATLLQRIVKRMEVPGDGKFRKISFTISDSRLQLSEDKQEFTEGTSALTSGECKVDMNSASVLDFIRFVQGKVTFRFSPDPKHPVIITSDTGLRCMASQMV